MRTALPARLATGFAAAFISVWTFSMGTFVVFQAAGAPLPFPPWSMMPVPPLGVPQIVSSAFWGGLWGVLYALLEPRLTARFSWWLGGLVYGLLPLLVAWFVVLPLKGMPVAGGFMPAGVLLGLASHTLWGLGTALFFRLGRVLFVGRQPAI